MQCVYIERLMLFQVKCSEYNTSVFVLLDDIVGFVEKGLSLSHLFE